MNGWEMKPLGEDGLLLGVHPGFACGKKDIAGGVPHLRMNNISKDGLLEMALIRRIPHDVAETQNRFVERGDILFNNTNSTELVGKSCIFTGWLERCTFSNHLTRLRPNPEKLCAEWLFMCLRDLWLQGYFAANCVEFVGQSAFNKDKLLEVKIPVPPLAEQRRLVCRIKTLTGRLEQARQARQAALAEAETILTSAVSEEMERAVESGESMELGQILTKVQYGTSVKASPEPNGLPVIRMGNIQVGAIKTTDLKYLQLPPVEVERYRLEKGDILINRTNSAALVGKAGLFNIEGDYLFASYLIRLCVDVAVADPEFVNYVINSEEGQAYLRGQGKDAIGQTNINSGQIRKMPIRLPDLPHQREAVARLNALRGKLDELLPLQREVETELAAFVPALLAKAFRGEL